MAGVHPYHHQQWAPPPPPPPAHMPPPENPNRPSTDEVRTIFISGLPEDVKERELQNLLRWLPGFEASQVNFKGDQPMGFALFSTVQLAMAAKDALQGMVFDTEKSSVLHTEMAKKNLFVKRGVVTDSGAFDQSKRMRTGGDYTSTGYPSPSPFHPHPPPPVWGPPGYMAPPPYDPYGGYPVPQVPLPAPAPIPPLTGYAPVQDLQMRKWIGGGFEQNGLCYLSLPPTVAATSGATIVLQWYLLLVTQIRLCYDASFLIFIFLIDFFVMLV